MYKRQTVSNEKGEFVLAGKWEQGVSIEFSFIGMRRKTITYKGQTKLEDVYKRQDGILLMKPLLQIL